jgi:hypothetical protein
MSRIDLVLRDEDLAKEEGGLLRHNNCGDELVLKRVKSTQVAEQVILLKRGHCFAKKKPIEMESIFYKEHDFLVKVGQSHSCFVLGCLIVHFEPQWHSTQHWVTA